MNDFPKVILNVTTGDNALGSYYPPNGAERLLADNTRSTRFGNILQRLWRGKNDRPDPHVIVSATNKVEKLKERIPEVIEEELNGGKLIKFCNQIKEDIDREALDIKVIGHEMIHLMQEVRVGTPSLWRDIYNNQAALPELISYVPLIKFFQEVEAYLGSLNTINGRTGSTTLDVLSIPIAKLMAITTREIEDQDLINLGPLPFVAMVMSGIPVEEVHELIKMRTTGNTDFSINFLNMRENTLSRLDAIPDNPTGYFEEKHEFYMSAIKYSRSSLDEIAEVSMQCIAERTLQGTLDESKLLTSRNGHLQRRN